MLIGSRTLIAMGAYLAFCSWVCWAVTQGDGQDWIGASTFVGSVGGAAFGGLWASKKGTAAKIAATNGKGGPVSQV